MLFSISIVFQGIPGIYNSTLWLFLNPICDAILCSMMPRFIIGVRELYDRDLRARWQGIDTGFGVLSKHSVNAVVSAIVFAEGAPGQGQRQGQVAEGDADDVAIRLEVLGEGTRQVVEGGGDDESEAIQLEARGDGTRQV